MLLLDVVQVFHHELECAYIRMGEGGEELVDTCLLGVCVQCCVCGVCAWVGGGDAKNEQLLRECQLASFDMNTSSKHSKFATVTALL